MHFKDSNSFLFVMSDFQIGYNGSLYLSSKSYKASNILYSMSNKVEVHLLKKINQKFMLSTFLNYKFKNEFKLGSKIEYGKI